MNAFDFYLSFYGLLLGLTVAEVASGFRDAIADRQTTRMGWLTPLLAVFVFLDITSFWIYFWGIRDSVRITWGTMFTGLMVALSYYISASLVFPRRMSEWSDLDDYYRRNKRFVCAGIVFANLIQFVAALILKPPVLDLSYTIAQLTYWPFLLVFAFSRNKKLDLAMLWILIAGYLINPLLPSSWILQ